MDRITKDWLDKRASLVNDTLGVKPGEVGSISIGRSDGKTKAYRTTWKGGSNHLISGTAREINTYLDGILEGVRMAAAHRENLAEYTDPDRCPHTVGRVQSGTWTCEACGRVTR